MQKWDEQGMKNGILGKWDEHQMRRDRFCNSKVAIAWINPFFPSSHSASFL